MKKENACLLRRIRLDFEILEKNEQVEEEEEEIEPITLQEAAEALKYAPAVEEEEW
jgi:hypothetical protein